VLNFTKVLDTVENVKKNQIAEEVVLLNVFTIKVLRSNYFQVALKYSEIKLCLEWKIRLSANIANFTLKTLETNHYYFSTADVSSEIVCKN
jgi:hypothetical protein